MTATPLHPYERVLLTEGALADLDLVAERSIEALKAVFRQLRHLDRGDVTPTPLHDYNKTGDLSDCRKIVVEVDGEPEYRIVVRETGGQFDVVEVLVVGARENDLAYLLEGLRLHRITEPVRRSDTQRRVAQIRRRLTRP